MMTFEPMVEESPDDEFLQTIDFDVLELIASSTSITYHTDRMNAELQKPEFWVYPGTSTDSSSIRFASVDEDQIKLFQEANRSTATKRNTRWGIKLFQGRAVQV